MKVALVTGSARGIGFEIAQRLSDSGLYNVIYSDVISKSDWQEKHGNDKDYIKCDISQSSDRKTACDYIIDRYGKIDLLVNNAGVAPVERKDILQCTEESFDRLIRINLSGCFFMCQTFANAMISYKTTQSLQDYAPRIVNIGSMSADTSSVSRGEYCISKAGVGMVTQLFADRLAEYGIAVFEVRPGIILTDMTYAVKEKYEEMIKNGITPIRRFGSPKDIANCVFVAAEYLSEFETGQILNSDGGFHLRRL